MRTTLNIILILFLASAVFASDANPPNRTQQRIWAVKNSDAFDRADVGDYRALNAQMTIFLSEAKLDHCEAYLIPSPEGPALLVLSNRANLVPLADVEVKLFALIDAELRKLLDSRKVEEK